MQTLTLTGRITEDGKLEVELPAGLPAIAVEVIIEMPVANGQDEPPMTEAEMQELLNFQPTSGADIIAAGLTGGWEHKGITNSAEWVEALRRKEEQRKWQTPS